MKLILAAVGKLKSGPESDLAARYATRAKQLAPRLGLAAPRVVEITESRAGRAEQRMAEEAAALSIRLPDGCRIVVFDERGKTLNSAQFAELIETARDAGRDVALVIGGPDGLDPAFRSQAAEIVSFGAMTMPHQLVRVALLEQIYRAMTILTGHPYHRT